MTQQQLIILLVLPFVLVVARGLFRRRESIAYRFRLVMIGELSYLGVALLLAHIGCTPTTSVLGGLVVALIVNMHMPKRSRHVRASVRRQKIREWESKTGTRFNPRKHELDHDVPFSRGGSNTSDNLRVLERKSNRAKGHKSPWWDLLGR